MQEDAADHQHFEAKISGGPAQADNIDAYRCFCQARGITGYLFGLRIRSPKGKAFDDTRWNGGVNLVFFMRSTVRRRYALSIIKTRFGSHHDDAGRSCNFWADAGGQQLMMRRLIVSKRKSQTRSNMVSKPSSLSYGIVRRCKGACKSN